MPHDEESAERIPLPASELPETIDERMSPSPFQVRLWEGRLLASRFRIVRFLARGGMGEVYEAEDLELGEHVAIKTVRPDLAWDEQALARFKQEIQLARKVTHP